MSIFVVVGTGLIGSKLVSLLTRDGHEVVAASRRSGVDAVTGEGVAEALSRASVGVGVSISPSFEAAAVMKFFKTSTYNLLTGEAAAGVGRRRDRARAAQGERIPNQRSATGIGLAGRRCGGVRHLWRVLRHTGQVSAPAGS